MARFTALFVIVLMALSVKVGCAAESNVKTTSHSRATLITDRDTVGKDSTLKVGLRLQLQPGWHTYWVNPGDAGDTPQLTVKATAGQHGESHNIEWPVPERINEGGLMAYAYTDDVLLSQQLSLTGDGSTTLTAHAEWLVCAQVCVPESGDFTLRLPYASMPVKKGLHASLFRTAAQKMPQSSPFQTTLSSQGILSVEGDGITPSSIKKAWFLPLKGGLINQTAEQPFSVTSHHFTLTLEADPSQNKLLWQKPLSGVVVMEDSTGLRSAISIIAQPKPVLASSQTALSMTTIHNIISYVKVLSYAFLGGLILNLMPCVFPVLAMKALSLVRMGGVGRRQHIESAVFYALGVVVSFVLMGALLIVLRYVGSIAGWGFQFQSPGFVVGVCWLLFVMALNLLGVFQLTTGRLVGRLDQLARLQGRGGDLLTGVLAVIVATPCTAPFMGVAIAGALSGSMGLGLIVFMAMGVGLALPYVVIATVPGVASRLPRPGAWMEILKQFLAFPLLASSVWLLWVVALQRGASFVAVTAGGAVLLALAVWAYGLAQRRAMSEGGHGFIRFYRLVAVLCVVLSVAGLADSVMEDTVSQQNSSISSSMKVQHTDMLEPFSKQRLIELRAEGRPVLVDMTASWCITCMVNERVALNVLSVQSLFKKQNIVTLRGDWTNRNEAISAYLTEQGRDGVPFYKYYPPHQKGIILPQVLTPKRVIKMIMEHAHTP